MSRVAGSMRFADLPVGRTAYRVRGPDPVSAEGPALLVLGGFHFPRNCDAFFDALSARLGQRVSILSYDYLGRGESDKPLDQPYTAERYLAQLDQLLVHLGLSERAWTVLGYSFGGALAVHAAHRWPERCGRLILSGAWAAWEPIPASARFMARLPGLRSLLYAIYWGTLRSFIRKGFNEPDEALIDGVMAPERAYRDADPDGLRAAILGTMADFDPNTRAKVKAIAGHPRQVWLIWGDNDQIAPYSYAEAMARVLPRARLLPLDGNHNDLWLEIVRKDWLLEALAAAIRTEEAR